MEEEEEEAEEEEEEEVVVVCKCLAPSTSGQLDERQLKLQKEVVDAKNGVSFVTVSERGGRERGCVWLIISTLNQDELQHVQVQLGVAGSEEFKKCFYIEYVFVCTSQQWTLNTCSNARGRLLVTV